MEKKNVVFLTVLAVATLLTAVVGTTFAYFTATITNDGTPEQVSVSAARLGASYSEGSSVLSDSNIYPGWTKSKTITLTSAQGTTVAVPFQVQVKSLSTSFVEDYVYACSDNTKLTESDCNATSGATWAATANKVCNLNVTITNDTTNASHSFPLCNDSTGKLAANTVIAADSIAVNGSVSYTVTATFTDPGYEQNANQGQTLSMEFEAVAVQVANGSTSTTVIPSN